jgi:hypothetical protein
MFCVCTCLFCVCVVLCLGRALATSWSLVQGVLPSVKWSRNWKKQRPGPKGAVEPVKKYNNSNNNVNLHYSFPFLLQEAWGIRKCCYHTLLCPKYLTSFHIMRSSRAFSSTILFQVPLGLHLLFLPGGLHSSLSLSVDPLSRPYNMFKLFFLISKRIASCSVCLWSSWLEIPFGHLIFRILLKKMFVNYGQVFQLSSVFHSHIKIQI